MARPTALNDTVRDVLVQAIKVGLPKGLACKYAGITHATLCNWMHRAEQAESPYVELFEELEKAEGESALRAMAQIETAARSGTWQAAAWKLERTYPDLFGRTVQEQKVTGQVVHAHAWIERLQKGYDDLDAKRVKQLPSLNGASNGTNEHGTNEQ